MRRTIRNGYEIDFDMQIYGRSTTNKDNTNLNKIWETFTFVEVLPPAAQGQRQNPHYRRAPRRNQRTGV